MKRFGIPTGGVSYGFVRPIGRAVQTEPPSAPRGIASPGRLWCVATAVPPCSRCLAPVAAVGAPHRWPGSGASRAFRFPSPLVRLHQAQSLPIPAMATPRTARRETAPFGRASARSRSVALHLRLDSSRDLRKAMAMYHPRFGVASAVGSRKFSFSATLCAYSSPVAEIFSLDRCRSTC